MAVRVFQICNLPHRKVSSSSELCTHGLCRDVLHVLAGMCLSAYLGCAEIPVVSELFRCTLHAFGTCTYRTHS